MNDHTIEPTESEVHELDDELSDEALDDLRSARASVGVLCRAGFDQ